MAPTIFIKFVDLLYIPTPTIWHYRLFSEKIIVTRIIFFLIFYLSPDVAPKVNDQSCSNLICSLLANISIPFFRFRSILKIKDNSHKEKFVSFNFLKNESSYFHKISWVSSSRPTFEA